MLSIKLEEGDRLEPSDGEKTGTNSSQRFIGIALAYKSGWLPKKPLSLLGVFANLGKLQTKESRNKTTF